MQIVRNQKPSPTVSVDPTKSSKIFKNKFKTKNVHWTGKIKIM